MNLFYTGFFIFLITSLIATQPTNLSVEEKVGQLLLVSVQTKNTANEAKSLINDFYIGGIIYYSWANNLTSADHVGLLSSDLQKTALTTNSKIPLLIAIDHEGGRVHRFEKDLTHFPPAFAYALINDTALTEACGSAMGRELRAVGITMNLAPVADILSNFENPVIGTRAFGINPTLVTKHCSAFMKGLHRAACLTSLKHFPGHGDTSTDSHTALPSIAHTREQLDAIELAPFFSLAQETDSIMTAHLMVPAFDDTTCSTLSPKTLNMLRNRAHFDGVIMTDSLVMQGLTAVCPSLEEAAIQAIQAGCDIVLIGGRCLVGSTVREVSSYDISRIHNALVEAVRSGRISREQLDTAVNHILKLKETYSSNTAESFSTLPLKEHQKLSYSVASQALNILKTSNRALPQNVVKSLTADLETLMEMYHESIT